LKAGRYGKHLFRRRRTEALTAVKPHTQARSRDLSAGWLEVSTPGPLHGVFSRKGQARKLLGLMTDEPDPSAAGVIRAEDTRRPSEQWMKGLKQWLGRGQYQNRSYRAAVTPLHLVRFAYALLTHLRVERTYAQGQCTRDKAADRSTAVAQDQPRWLVCEDLVAYLQEKPDGEAILTELERRRVASHR
jgi:hypothetical protein